MFAVAVVVVLGVVAVAKIGGQSCSNNCSTFPAHCSSRRRRLRRRRGGGNGSPASNSNISGDMGVGELAVIPFIAE